MMAQERDGERDGKRGREGEREREREREREGDGHSCSVPFFNKAMTAPFSTHSLATYFGIPSIY